MANNSQGVLCFLLTRWQFTPDVTASRTRASTPFRSTFPPLRRFRPSPTEALPTSTWQPAGRIVEGQSTVYQRLWNPTVARFEAGVALLEGAPEAVAFATGMAALSAVLLATVAGGKKHVVAVRPLYGGSDHILASGVLGTEVTFTDAGRCPRCAPARYRIGGGGDPGQPEPGPRGHRSACGRRGRRAGAGGQHLRQPQSCSGRSSHGAALVLHSATKFMGGHGDAMGGVVAASAEWASRLRQVRAITGGILTPLPAYLLHRGLATLPGPRPRAAVSRAQGGLRARAATSWCGPCTTRGCLSAIRRGWWAPRCRARVR